MIDPAGIEEAPGPRGNGVVGTVVEICQRQVRWLDGDALLVLSRSFNFDLKKHPGYGTKVIKLDKILRSLEQFRSSCNFQTMTLGVHKIKKWTT